MTTLNSPRYLEFKKAQAEALVGKRIEIPVHYDMWMRGARFGTVTTVSKDGSFIRVQMEHHQVQRRLKVWRADFDYIKIL